MSAFGHERKLEFERYSLKPSGRRCFTKTRLNSILSLAYWSNQVSEVNIRHYKRFLKTFILSATACIAITSFASSNAQELPNTPAAFSVFVPKAQTVETRFDYGVWDDALQDVVVQMGPSLRRFAKRPRGQLGTLLSFKERRSRYRLEGSRVTFHYMSDKYLSSLTEYKDDLLRLANDHDIQAFDRNEQLAFWINLHNVVLIETIAKNHPTSNPSALLFGAQQQPLHEAKLMTIKNVALSLKDIRENIVYKNWDNPNVIYGFFRGDIGGPGLVPYAVTAENVKHVLSLNGFEYISSLRGFHTTKKERKVSQIYNEARPYFFPNWPQDIEDHFKTYLKEHNLLDQIEQDKPISFIEYDTIIADLWGGNISIGSYSVSNQLAPAGTPPILFERAEKIQELKIKGRLKRKHSVTIEDIETEDQSVVK